MAATQLCRKCRFMHHSSSRVPCLSCDSVRLTIPCSENLVGIVEKLLNRCVDVVSASCDVHDLIDYFNNKVQSGKTVQIQIELGKLYPIDMFEGLLSPGWLTYEYHTIIEHNKIGPKCLGLSFSEDFIPLDEDELEFQAALAINNLEASLDNTDQSAYRSVWKLAGEI